MTAPIRIEVIRDKRDYMSALWGNYINGGGLLWALGGAVVFFGVMSCIFTMSNEGAAFGAAAVGTVAYLIAVVGVRSVAIALAASRSAGQPGAMDPIVFVFTPEAIDVSAVVGSGTSKWVVWRRAFETSRVLVIRHRLNMLQLLPLRQIPPKTLAELRQLLRLALDGRVKFKEARAV